MTRGAGPSGPRKRRRGGSVRRNRPTSPAGRAPRRELLQPPAAAPPGASG
ncbi:hypothetical protein F750_2558 [Streptomyces sp. PAMC 26508]|nr:hypothetical protein F750_2558 [Streptomyces sp. PAMC 26508]